MIRACARIEQLRRREGLEVAYPVFPFSPPLVLPHSRRLQQEVAPSIRVSSARLFRDGDPRRLA